MRKKLKMLVGFVLIFALGMSMIGCGQKKSSTGLVDFKIACATWVGNGMFFLAQEKGFFEENGVNVEVKIVDDESTYASLLSSNQVDAVGRAADQDIINYANGIKEKCFMTYDQSSGGDGIVASEEIKSVEDLKGKTVAVAKATTSYFLLLTVLEANNVSEDELTIKDMDADSAGTAFVQGEVDAAVTWEPWLSNASEREGGHLLCDSKDYPNTIVDAAFVNDKFSSENPEALKGVVKGIQKAYEWYYDGNQDEGNKIMADALGIDLADFEEQIKGVTWFGPSEMKSFFDKSNESSIYSLEERAAKFWVERSLITDEFDVDGFITSDFIE